MLVKRQFVLQIIAVILIYLCLLPNIPDQAIGPYLAINPYDITKLALFIFIITAVGNALIQTAASYHAILLTGFLGGFTSSTATVVAMASLVKHRSIDVGAAASAAIASNVATFIQAGMLIGFISPRLLAFVMIPLCIGIGVAAILSMLTYKQIAIDIQYFPQEISVYAQFKKTIGIICMLCSMMLLIAAARFELGDQGVNIAAFMSGLVDGHASAISVSEMVTLNKISVDKASLPVLIGLTSNSIMRAVLACMSGNLKFVSYVSGALLISVIAIWIAYGLL